MNEVYFRVKNNSKNFWLDIYLIKQFIQKQLKLNFRGTKTIDKLICEKTEETMYD